MEGRILSFESMGLVDGPGIRTVVFMQGCPLRCKFCHNPESWECGGGQTISSEELFEKIKRFRPYFERSGGGVTFSGGEPLLQKDFVLEVFKMCKAAGIHTCLDTSGAVKGDYEELLRYTDLVLYDVKAVDAEGYRNICGGNIAVTENFQRALRESGTETVIRQVVVPGINDSGEYMEKLRNYIEKNIPQAKKVELLPYHLMGLHKYKKLGPAEPIAGVPAMSKPEA
jgi:pyruvate formate lyase activating enzyme